MMWFMLHTAHACKLQCKLGMCSSRLDHRCDASLSDADKLNPLDLMQPVQCEHIESVILPVVDLLSFCSLAVSMSTEDLHIQEIQLISPHLPTEKPPKQIHKQITRATSCCNVSMLNIKACDSTVSKRLKKRGLLESVWKTLVSIKNM